VRSGSGSSTCSAAHRRCTRSCQSASGANISMGTRPVFKSTVEIVWVDTIEIYGRHLQSAHLVVERELFEAHRASRVDRQALRVTDSALRGDAEEPVGNLRIPQISMVDITVFYGWFYSFIWLILQFYMVDSTVLYGWFCAFLWLI
jgi:hypothetical protein